MGSTNFTRRSMSGVDEVPAEGCDVRFYSTPVVCSEFLIQREQVSTVGPAQLERGSFRSERKHRTHLYDSKHNSSSTCSSSIFCGESSDRPAD